MTEVPNICSKIVNLSIKSSLFYSFFLFIDGLIDVLSQFFWIERSSIFPKQIFAIVQYFVNFAQLFCRDL